MNCTDARHLIHLDAGDDLRSSERHSLQLHLSQCAECTDYRSGMSVAMSALFRLRDSGAEAIQEAVTGTSVWSAVSREITKRKASLTRYRKFNLQVVALCVCSLSLAVVTIVQTLSSMRQSSGGSGSMPGQSVAYPSMQELPDGLRRSPDGLLLPLAPENTSELQSF